MTSNTIDYEKLDQVEATNELGPVIRSFTSDGHRASESPRKRLFKAYFFPILHISSCIALSFCMVYILDGYRAVPTEASRYSDDGRYKLKVSDVTTLVSTALIVVRILAGVWLGDILWNCTFILLEKRGLTLPQVDRIMSFYLPPIPKSSAEVLVVLLLLLVIPQSFMAPLLTGAVNWSPSFEFSNKLRNTAAGNPDANPLSWFWYYYSAEDRQASVRRAAALSALAWDGAFPDRYHSRHVLNYDPNESITVNSTLFNAVIPCIQIHSIEFPTTDPPEKVFKIANDSVYDIEASGTILSRAKDAPLKYGISGNAVLFDPDDRPNLHEQFPNRNDSTFEMERPADYLHTGIMYAVILLGIPGVDGPWVGCEEFNASIFGRTYNNKWKSVDHGNYDWCHTYAIVNLTAGISDSPRSTYVSNRVVEAEIPSKDMEVRGGPWVKEAMYLMPDVMSHVAMMNTTALHTWNDIEGYLDKLIRYSYQGTWDMLYRTYEIDNRTLDVQYYEVRVLASLSRVRVFAWLGVSFLVTVSAVCLVLGKKWSCERAIVIDGPVAALVTDSTAVLEKGGRDLTNLSYVTKEKKLGKVKLERLVDGSFRLRP